MAIDPATLKVAAKIATTVLSSPFAIYFALLEGQQEQISVVSVLYDLRQDFEYRLQIEQEDPTAQVVDTINMGSEDGTTLNNTEDVLIAFAIKYNMTKENAQ